MEAALVGANSSRTFYTQGLLPGASAPSFDVIETKASKVRKGKSLSFSASSSSSSSKDAPPVRTIRVSTQKEKKRGPAVLPQKLVRTKNLQTGSLEVRQCSQNVFYVSAIKEV